LQPRDPEYSKKITDIYKNTSTIGSRLDIRVLLTNLKYPDRSIINTKKPVEIVIFDQKCSKEEADIFIQDHLANKSMNYRFINYVCGPSPNYDKNAECNDQMKIYKNVCTMVIRSY